MTNFNQAFKNTMGHEGGYVDDNSRLEGRVKNRRFKASERKLP
jgi:hypothetical protein